MKSVSISLERKLLTCVDTIWPDVIHVETVGMGFHSAHVTKILLESTVASMKVGMKMCFPQNLVVLARILPNHKTNILHVRFLPASHPCVHVVDIFQRRHTYILRRTLFRNLHYLYFLYSYTVFSIQTEIKFCPLFRPILCYVFLLYGLWYGNWNSFFVKTLSCVIRYSNLCFVCTIFYLIKVEIRNSNWYEWQTLYYPW